MKIVNCAAILLFLFLAGCVYNPAGSGEGIRTGGGYGSFEPFNCSAGDFKLQPQGISPPAIDYLPSGKSPHAVRGAFVSLEASLQSFATAPRLENVKVAKGGSFDVWLQAYTGSDYGNFFNVYAERELLLNGSFTVESGGGAKVVIENGKAFLEGVTLTAQGGVSFEGDFEVDDGAGGERVARTEHSVTWPVKLNLVRGRVEFTPQYPLEAGNYVEFSGELDVGGEKRNGKFSVLGDVAVSPGTFEGTARQVFQDGKPLLEAQMEASPKPLCFTVKSDRASIPVTVREVSGNATAENLKFSLSPQSSAMRVEVPESVAHLLSRTFVMALTLGALGGVTYSTEAGQSFEVFLQVEPSGNSTESILVVSCDNCKPVQVPVLIRRG